ncbi:MAG: ARMT1-like domain-containing protein [Proteobacteria bacterium]|nr:ARMT1-like domain-containing protein [Pseudomonadota bacterium]
MKPHPECGACLVHWVFERTAPYTPEGGTAVLVRNIVGVLLSDVSPQANVGSLCNGTVHAVFDSTPGLPQHYEDLKHKSNENAKMILVEAMEYINKEETLEGRLSRACFLAAAANIAPLNAPSSPYTFQEIRDLMHLGDAKMAVMGDLFGALKNARHVFYVTDNAGEIGFDSLVIRQIKDMGLRITLVVKKQTFFEDATMIDVNTFGLEGLVDEIITVPGFLAPDKMDKETAASFKSCDLVIAKGTGSYEAIHGEIPDKKAVYMLKIKCKPIARELGMDGGNVIVKVE